MVAASLVKTGDPDLTTAAMLFALCGLVVAAFALFGFRDQLLGCGFGRLSCRCYRSLGGLGLRRAVATARAGHDWSPSFESMFHMLSLSQTLSRLAVDRESDDDRVQ
jgi:hypothetical protein